MSLDKKEEKKTTHSGPKAVGLSLDFDKSGDALVPEKELEESKIISNILKKSIRERREPYKAVIGTLTEEVKEKKNVLGYSASNRLSLAAEVKNYQAYGTCSITTYETYFEEEGFTNVRFSYRDIEKRKENPEWKIGQSMQEAMDFFKSRTPEQIKGADPYQLDHVSITVADQCRTDKSMLLEEQLKDFKARIDKIEGDNDQPCPFYYKDDSNDLIKNAATYFRENPEKIPEGVELHLLQDRQVERIGMLDYYGVCTRSGSRAPTLKEMQLKNKLLYPILGELGIIVEHPLTSAILKGPSDFRSLVATHKGDINKHYATLSFEFTVETPLTLALGCKNQEAVQALLECKEIDVNKYRAVTKQSTSSTQWQAPIVLAIVNKNDDAVDQLLAHPEIKLNLNEHWETNPLMAALNAQDLGSFKKLLRHPSMDVDKVRNLVYTIRNAGKEYLKAWLEEVPGLRLDGNDPYAGDRLRSLLSSDPEALKLLEAAFERGAQPKSTVVLLDQHGFEGIHQALPDVASSACSSSSSSSSSISIQGK